MPYLTGIGQRSESSTNTSGTAFVPLMPHRAGDIIILGLDHMAPAEASGVAVAGFTKKIDQANGDNSMQIWWRRAAADNEAPPIITHTFGTGLQGWQPFKITGAVATGDPFDVTAVTTQASSTTHTCPTVTTTVDDCGILTVVTSYGAPVYSGWANAATSPRMVARGQSVFGGLYVVGGWGHKTAAGVVGTTTLTSGTAVASTVATLAVKPGPVDLSGAGTWRDSILSSEPASASTITLPTFQSGDLLVAVVAGGDATKVAAATLTGFTKLIDLPKRTSGMATSVLTQRATGGTSNPTVTHTFGGGDDWVVTIFAVSGYLAGWVWELGLGAGTAHAAIQNFESPAAGKVVALFSSPSSIATTSCLFDVATGETEVEDGGPVACRVSLYHADSAAGWLGAPTWTVDPSTTTPHWLSMTFSDAPAPAVTPVVGDNQRIGETGAIRRSPNSSR